MIFVKANENDWNILLNWRNEKTTRENSLNSKIITEEEHKKWFFSSLKNSNRIIYIVYDNEEKIGTVRIDFEENKDRKSVV